MKTSKWILPKEGDLLKKKNNKDSYDRKLNDFYQKYNLFLAKWQKFLNSVIKYTFRLKIGDFNSDFALNDKRFKVSR